MVILKDYPLFLCEFHVNFVNALPEHAIQLKNMILAAHPPNMQIPYPHSKDLKIDTITEVRSPRILSMFDSRFFDKNVGVGNEGKSIRDELELYFLTRKPALVSSICDKLIEIRDKVGSKNVPCSSVMHNTVLYVVMKALNDPQLTIINSQEGDPVKGDKEVTDCVKECFDLIKQIAVKLDE
jgi:CCR4-NOT transcription complex subunit 1